MRKIKDIYTGVKRHAGHTIILEFSKKVSALIDVTLQEKSLQFVGKVIADYNYYTQKL
ncbi:hypothetical protein [Aquimarina sp. I32.4]|uniref:hypothetical protein n=1 Tax=Aquimarina sp. I32.4 TaxID=2053903 RepID=UPI001304EC7F|nr:hypothetical protein [Aquimarina sp. I32.4]